MESPEINKRIKQVIDYKTNGNVKKFAEIINLPQQTVNRLFVIDKRTNKYPIATTDILQKISEMYENISPDWLLTGNGEMLKTDYPVATKSNRGIPLVTQNAVAGFGNGDFSISEQDVKDYYVIPKFKYNRVDFMIEVSGSSMYPKYNSGDIVACTIIREESFIQWNKCHVIATKEQGILVKRIKRGDDNNSFLLISDNKDYDPFLVPREEITGIALVIGVIRLE